MSIAERLVDKIEPVDVVILSIVGVMMLLVLVVFASQAPFVAVSLATLGFLAWAGVRSGVLKKEKEDPLEQLNRRYANDEITREEWERKRDDILAAKEAETSEQVDAGDLLEERV